MKRHRDRQRKSEIREAEDANVVMIDGVPVPGFVSEDPCPVCGTLKVYHESYDALFCPDCRKWLESKCFIFAPWCEYCRNRPKYPLEG